MSRYHCRQHPHFRFKGAESLSERKNTCRRRKETLISFFFSATISVAPAVKKKAGGNIEENENGRILHYDEMAGFESLYQAHLKSQKGKRNKSEVIEFEMNPGLNLVKLRAELMNESYYPGTYDEFKIYDPKERIIHASGGRTYMGSYSRIVSVKVKK